MTRSSLLFQDREQSLAKNLNYTVKETSRRDESSTKMTLNDRAENRSQTADSS